MPTVLRFDAYRVVIYTNDHRPAHVHVVGPQGRAIFELNLYGSIPRSLLRTISLLILRSLLRGRSLARKGRRRSAILG